MYIYAGHDEVFHSGGVLGIFDLDNISQSKRTRDFLSAAEKAGEVAAMGTDLPKAMILYDGRGKTEVVLVQTTTSTIAKRITKTGVG